MKTILYNPIFINPLAYYVFPRLTRYLQPDNESTAEPANYIGTIEVKVIAYGDTTLKRTYTNTDSIDLSEFKNTWIRISLFTKVGSCVLGEWKIGNMESDLPYIDPEVLASLKAVVIVGNKTNNDSDRAIVKNLVDASNPFVISNASYNLNSGYGKYNITFQHFPYRENIISINDNKVVFDKGGLLLLPYPSMDRDIPSFKVKVSGLSGTYHFRYYYRDSNGAQDSINMAKDGIYELPICYNVQSSSDGTNCGFANNGSDIVTIELVPEFQGAFVTDGVNDVITSTKTALEMLGETNEITVVSMIHQITLNGRYNIGLTNYIRSGVTGNSSPYLRSLVTDSGKTGIYGYTAYNLNKNIDKNSAVINNILGDKNDYYLDTNNDYILDDSLFSVQNFVHRDGSISDESSSVAWYWTIIANKVLTTDQINQVIAYFNLDRTLKPDILCDVKKQGITNDNHAEFGDKLIDFSGNGRDIQLNNIAWDGDSGIGKYNYPNWKVTATIANTYSTIVNYPTVNGTYSINVNGVSELMQSIGMHLEIRYTTSTGIIYNDIKQDGVYSYILPDGATNLTLRFGGIPGIVNEPCNITITQIPSHAGALCLDGVNDFGKVTGMPIYKDYTIVVDYERISGREEALISKAYIVNQGAFVLMETSGTAKHSYSFGAYTAFNRDDFTRTLLYQSKYKCGDVNLTIGKGIDGDTLWLGTLRNNDYRFFNGAIYSLMSFPYSMSEFLIERQLKKHKLGTLYPNMVEFRPVIKSNASYDNIVFYYKNEKVENGTYLTVGSSIGMHIHLSSSPVNEIKSITVNGIPATFKFHDANNNIYQYDFNLTSKSPQKINITIDEYIRYEDIVQPYPVLLRFKDENGNEVSWGGKFKVGSTITRIGSIADPESNLLNGLYSISGLSLNGKGVTSSTSIVEKQMVFKTTATWLLDNNEPKCILSPSRLRIPNSSYKILGYIPDISGHGNHGVIHNSAYAGASGANGYLQNFSGWTKASGVSSTDSVISSSNNLVAANGWIAYVTSGTVIPTFKVEISGIPINSNLRFEGSGQTLVNGVNTIQGLTTTKISGFYISNGYDNDWSNLRIEQVGEYEGAYCLDGVDDFVTIPTLSSGGKQVLMKVNWNTIDSIIYDQRGSGGFAIYCSDYNNPSDSIIPAYKGRNAAGTTYIDGIRNEYIIASQLRNVTHNIVEILDTSYAAGNINPIIGKSHMNSNYGNLALYDFMLFDNISTDDKIKELNEYVGIEAKVELPPYYWDAYGKTNLDGDKATIQQRGVAVGDYDLTNYNHAYEGMSGYNGYPVVFGASKTWDQMSTGTFTWNIEDNKLHITKALIAGNGLLFSYVKLNGSLLNVKEIPSFKIKVSGLEGKSKLLYRYLKTEDAISETIAVLENGIHELPKSYTPSDSLHDGVWVGFTVSPISEGVKEFDCDITIEVLPEYENGLVYDGVDDYSKNENIPVLTDYTIIAKRLWINKDNPLNEQFIHKGAINTPIRESAFMLECEIANDTYYRSSSYGGYINIERSNRPERIVYQTSNSYNGISITKGSGTDTTGIVIGGVTNNYWNGVFYKLMLYSKTLPLLQINYLKNLMEKDEIIDLNNKIFIQE